MTACPPAIARSRLPCPQPAQPRHLPPGMRRLALLLAAMLATGPTLAEQAVSPQTPAASPAAGHDATAPAAAAAASQPAPARPETAPQPAAQTAGSGDTTPSPAGTTPAGSPPATPQRGEAEARTAPSQEQAPATLPATPPATAGHDAAPPESPRPAQPPADTPPRTTGSTTAAPATTAPATAAPAAPPAPAQTPPLPPTGTQPLPAGSSNTRLPAAPDTTDERKLARTCVVPESLRSAPVRLPGLTAALVRGKGDLLVLVLGSDSTHADGRSPRNTGTRSLRREPPPRQTPLTARLQEHLSRELPPIPGRSIKVESVGRQNSTVAEQAALIGKQVLPRKPALVIWNLGRTDARRGLPAARMAQALDRGLKQLRAQKVDTIVLDPPYHPQFEALYRTDDYRQYLRWTINLHDQPAMRRYDMIDYWASTGRIDLDSGDAERQERAVVFTETCIAWQLSRMIDRALN